MRGETEGRTRALQVTIFDSVSAAIEDLSVLEYVYIRRHGNNFYVLADLNQPENARWMLARAET